VKFSDKQVEDLGSGWLALQNDLGRIWYSGSKVCTFTKPNSVSACPALSDWSPPKAISASAYTALAPSKEPRKRDVFLKALGTTLISGVVGGVINTTFNH
jgi:hypothetical protein